MLKRERLQKIVERVNATGIVTVNEIIEELGVSDMTARRDLDELDKEGLVNRVHGGAKKIIMDNKHEKSHIEKHELQNEEKKEIATAASKLIKDGETIFMGPGTTLEYLAQELLTKKIRVITNSLPVFNILIQSKDVDLILIGGEYRNITGAFVGSLATANIQQLKFSKAFISANGVFEGSIATYNESEGECQRRALDNSLEKYLLVDNKKFNQYDFYDFYKLADLDCIITDSKIDDETKKNFGRFVKIFVAPAVRK
ncbi:MAG: DeoR/GlpR family DNA-binding transcription regulator [Erysipelotrichaceae bacterium]|nr:DeoR/GlpR family DNA-binding transcription regulator [Erysipelotrichaceae bacterium]MDD3810604.1 DeoR/GlpR family DNA-binding transcription regulator [Erysipelotrichaceae bacterium]